MHFGIIRASYNIAQHKCLTVILVINQLNAQILVGHLSRVLASYSTLDSGREIITTRRANSRPTVHFHVSLKNSVKHVPVCLKS